MTAHDPLMRVYLQINIEQPCHSATGGIDFFDDVRRGSIFSSLHDNTDEDVDEKRSLTEHNYNNSSRE